MCLKLERASVCECPSLDAGLLHTEIPRRQSCQESPKAMSFLSGSCVISQQSYLIAHTPVLRKEYYRMHMPLTGMIL